MARVRYMEVAMAKLPRVIMPMKMVLRNSSSGCRRRLNVLTIIIPYR